MGGMFHDALSFNQDLSGWCVANITSEPYAFDDGATSWVLPRPIWGTCIVPDPIAHWKLDETSGTIAYDDSGNNYDGTLHGPVWELDGHIDSALKFDGSNDYVEIDGGEDSNNAFKGVLGSQSRTVAAWIKVDTDGAGAIVHWGELTSGGRWTLMVNYHVGAGVTGALRMSVYYGRIVGTTDLCDNEWHHVAAVLENDGSPVLEEIKLYVDGAEETISYIDDEDLVINTVEDADQGMLIGGSADPEGDPNTISLPFGGLIDDVRIYDRALIAGQIEQLYQGGLN